MAKKQKIIEKLRFRMKLANPKILKILVETLSMIVDETNLVFTSKSLNIKMIDPSRICLLETIMKKDLFEEYECNGECIVGIRLDDLNKILKRCSLDDNIELSYHEEEQKIKVKMIRKGTERARTFSLKLLELEVEDVPLENLKNIEYPTTFSFKPEIFIEAIKDSKIYSDILNIQAKEDIGINITAEGQLGELEYQLSLDDFLEHDIKEIHTGSFSLEFLKAIMKLDSIIETFKISLKSENPIKLNFNLLEGVKLEYFLAPRLEGSESEELLEDDLELDDSPDIEEGEEETEEVE